ncbi:MAG: hypothetical protein IJW93_02795 [Clostridia bacterium]|nr:hypothetical protein [Clostridia bacterium]
MRITISRKTQDLLKKVGCIVLACLAVFGCVSAFSALSEKANEDYQEIHPSYTIGDIDKSTGKSTDDDDAIYTKDLIECTGFELYADFDSNIAYTVHYYDEDDKWISCVENTELSLKVATMPENAHGIRIVIYPQDDTQVSFTEKYEYASQLTVKITTEEAKTDSAE